MKRDLEPLARTHHDLVIVGGGIYGVSAAREAALRGLKVCLVERGDFGGATSSQSLKIIHGGLRYLQHLDLPRVREHIAERRTLMRIAPHLVAPLGCVIPTYGHGARGKEAFRIALTLNDLAGFDRDRGLDERLRIPRGRVLSREEFLRLCPGVPADGVSGGALFWDGQAWSTERLLLAFLESAVRAGAHAANYAHAVGALGHARRVEGVRVRDGLSGRFLEVRGSVVLNATGPWVDGFLSSVGAVSSSKRFRPSKAMNLVVRRVLFPGCAVGVPGTSDFHDEDAIVDRGARMIFVVPWHGRSPVGRKHLPYEGSPDEFRIQESDVDGFLAEINAALPDARLTRADVVAVQGGMLPEKARGGAGVQLEKRPRLVDHAREDGIEGLLTVVGVKWTTARRVASEVVALVLEKLGRRAAPAPRKDPPLAGGEIDDLAKFLDDARRRMPASVSVESAEHVLRAHGTGFTQVISLVEQDAQLGRPVSERSAVIGAEIVHAAHDEMAEHLEDVLLRRTELWLAAPLEPRTLERCADLMAGPLQWSRERRVEEIDRALEALRLCYLGIR